MYVASDLAALVRHTTTVAHLDDGELATVTATGFTTYRRRPDAAPRKEATDASTSTRRTYDAGDHESFMRKEILEQPDAAERVLRGRLDERFGTAHLGGLNMDARDTRAIRRVKILGCGSAYYVGQMGAALIEELARIPADAEAASEFRYRNPVIEPDTLYVAVSQSGETIDTLLAVQEIRRKGGRVIGLVNVVGSAIARECDGGIYLHAGPEVAVASTKALTNMFLGFALLALQLGRVRDLSIADGRRLIAGLRRLPGQIAEILDREDELRRGRRCGSPRPRACSSSGRVRGFPVAREGAQKFKEISYRHAEAYQTSELKHGPLALIAPAGADRRDRARRRARPTATSARCTRSPPAAGRWSWSPTRASTSARSRRSRIDVPRNERELDPILLTIPLQLLAYHAALHARPRHRQAAQPGQVGHRRVTRR